MDFDFNNLPDTAFEKIYQYLPFKDRVRTARVAKCFFRWSEIFIFKTESINLEQLQKLNNPLYQSAFERLLNSCSNNLKKIKFDGYCQETVNVFEQFYYPVLEELDLGNVRIDNYTFGTLIILCPNLKILIRDDHVNDIEFPRSGRYRIERRKLEILRVGCGNDNSFISLRGQLPNLKHFEMKNGCNIRKVNFDNFFASCPLLETVIIHIIHEPGTKFKIDDELVHFWRLKSLRRLELSSFHSRINIDTFKKISESFPQLEVLKLNGAPYTACRGISALVALENLRILSLERCGCLNNEAIQVLAKCGRLEEVDLAWDIALQTFAALIQHCHDLRILKIHYGIDWYVKADQLAGTLRSFSDLSGKNRKLTIKVHYDRRGIWESHEVDLALRQLVAQGHNIKVEITY